MAAWSPILAFRVPAWTEPKGIDILTFMVALIDSSVGGEVAVFNGTINRPFLHTACKSWLRSDVPRVSFETTVAQAPVGEGLAVMRRDNHFWSLSERGPAF